MNILSNKIKFLVPVPTGGFKLQEKLAPQLLYMTQTQPLKYRQKTDWFLNFLRKKEVPYKMQERKDIYCFHQLVEENVWTEPLLLFSCLLLSLKFQFLGEVSLTVLFFLFLVLLFGMCPEIESKKTAQMGASGIIYDRCCSGLRDFASDKMAVFYIYYLLSYKTHFNVIASITISNIPLQYYSVAEQVMYPLSHHWDNRAIQPNHINYMTSSALAHCADVNSHYKRDAELSQLVLYQS